MDPERKLLKSASEYEGNMVVVDTTLPVFFLKLQKRNYVG